MVQRTKLVTAIALGVAATTVLSGCRAATPPRDPARAVNFSINKIATNTGAAFTVTGNVLGNKNLEIVTTSFNFTPPVGGPPSPLPGSVTIYQGSGTSWTPTNVVTPADGITSPNQPNIVDVDGDGLNDVIVPAGYFFTRISPPSVGKGSITWWKNNGDGTFTRNNVVTGALGSYHVATYTDMDKDGIKDILTVLEDGGWPSYPFGVPPFVPASAKAPQVSTQFIKGLGGGTFAAPVDLAPNGGSKPVVFDVDQDGDLDVASAQYFGTKTSPIVIPPQGVNINNESFIWLENTSAAGDTLDASKFTKHVIATGLGESFEIAAIDNIDGNGGYGAIGVNHTNPAIAGSALPQVVRLTPGSDIRAPWTVSTVADNFSVDDTRNGQAAPGFLSDGDVDGDGDVDLVISGDADWTVYWLERKADGSWAKHDLIAEFGTAGNFGQGSVNVADLNRDGKNEIVFSSYNDNSISIASRNSGTGGIVPSLPRVPDPLQPY